MSISRTSVSIADRIPSSPFDTVAFYCHRYKADENFVELSLAQEMQKAKAQKYVHAYVQQALGPFEPTFIKAHTIHPTDQQIPPHIFLKATQARKALDTLMRNRELSEASRTLLEPGLTELERSVEWARQVKSQLSVGQEDLIQSFTRLYLDAIRAEIPNTQTAKDWIHYTAMQMRALGPDECTRTIRTVLRKHFSCGDDKSAELYESLCLLARTYAGLCNIEVSLVHTGDGIPSLDLIQKTIDETLDA